MSQEPEYEDFERSYDADTGEHALNHWGEGDEEEQASEVLPFGMSGVTGILHKLHDSLETGDWSPNKQRMVAEYILGLAKEYWLSPREQTFCREVLGR